MTAVHPDCLLWRTDSTRHLHKYVAQGGCSLIGFAETVGHVAINWPIRNSDHYSNVNTAAHPGKGQGSFGMKAF